MDNAKIIKKTEQYVKQKLSGEITGHDWWHIYRVREIAKKLARKEGGELFTIELAALLHDIADWKFHGDEHAGSKVARKLLTQYGVDRTRIEHICYIIDHLSFKGAQVKNQIHTIEGKIVQDADRLDVLGAIGIARVFAYGGYKIRPLHDPAIKPKQHKTFAEYKKSASPSITHFYEKVLLLKDRMNTKTARKFALRRHKFVEHFLKEFFLEWDGKDF